MDLNQEKVPRLNNQDLQNIKQAFLKYFLPQDHLWIFGSRANPKAKGGDIDLYIETNYLEAEKVVEAEIKFLSELYIKIGEQKIDLVIQFKNSNRLIDQIARQEGIQLL